jgi:predicted alpha/beta hydrolase family esterase
MQKRVFIVHGWGGHPDEGWQKWLKMELEKKDFKVFSLAMPDSERPVINIWVNHLNVAVGNPDENTYFVGHSIGCQTIMRYLETINKKVGGAIYVAGWFDLQGLESEEEKEIARPWIVTSINFEKIKNNCEKSTAIFSDDDPYVKLEFNKKIFEDNLGAEVIIEKGRGHFDAGNIPIILERIK